MVCVVYTVGLGLHASTVLHLNGTPVTTVMDSGSTITLMRPSVFAKPSLPCSSLAITWVHRNVREVPAAEVLQHCWLA